MNNSWLGLTHNQLMPIIPTINETTIGTGLTNSLNFICWMAVIQVPYNWRVWSWLGGSILQTLFFSRRLFCSKDIRHIYSLNVNRSVVYLALPKLASCCDKYSLLVTWSAWSNPKISWRDLSRQRGKPHIKTHENDFKESHFQKDINLVGHIKT